MPTSFSPNDGEKNKTIGNVDNPSFINHSKDNSAATKSNAIEIPSIALPKGAGQLKVLTKNFPLTRLMDQQLFLSHCPLHPEEMVLLRHYH
jgi:hypothetical protein